MKLPFEQLPKESDVAFAAFTAYLNMGQNRSAEAVAAKLGKSKRLMQKWSARHDWLNRVNAHHDYWAAISRESAENVVQKSATLWANRREEQLQQEWKLRNELYELALIAIERWKENETGRSTLEGIARLIDLSSKLGRLASGLATDKTELTGENGGPLQIEFTRALDKVYGPAIDIPQSPA